MTDFFDIQREQSQVKAKIVAEYFKQWSKVMTSNIRNYGAFHNATQIIYLDLYSGPGAYADKRNSTPLLILKEALSRDDLKTSLYCIFNDSEENNIRKLKENIQALSIKELTFTPRLFVNEVDQQIVDQFKNMTFPPTLMFADPFGYKGLTLELVNSVLKDFGCECVFFFNYNRMQAAITNPLVEKHVDALFGTERAAHLRATVNASPNKEQLIMDSLHAALVETHGKYYCDFRFPDEKRDCTSHYLVYVTKDQLGYKIMKPIMAKASSVRNQFGIYSFQFDPRDSLQLSLFNPLDELGDQLFEIFTGQTIKLDDFAHEHSIGTTFIRANYVETVWKLHDQRKVSFSGKVPKQRNHCGENTLITFH